MGSMGLELIEAAGERLARRPAGGRGAKRWPMDGASAATTVFTRSIGELTVLEFAGRPTLRSAARPEGAAAAKSAMLLLALAEGACAYRGVDGRLHGMRAKEVLVADYAAAVELHGEEGSRLVGLSAPTHLMAPRFLTRERLRAGTLTSHGRGVAGLLYDLLIGLGDRRRAAPGAGALADAVGGLLSATLEDCLAVEAAEPGEAGRARLEQIV